MPSRSILEQTKFGQLRIKSFRIGALLLLLAAVVGCAPVEKNHWVVAADGSGDYRSVQECLDALPSKPTTWRTVEIKSGEYREKVTLDVYKDKVHIIGPGTDLTFSIKGMPAIPCAGEMNIPDGEVFTAPILDSVNGTIHYTAPTVYQGIPFDGIRLTFENGKIVEAHCNGKDEELNKILDTDAGARFIGEFALGVNPYILKPMYDILFDEKIAGSFHFTPGQAYENCDNTNRSQVHWDMVCIQRPEYGGGEIWFDDELIRKDGIFTDPELAILNPAKN